MGSSTMALQVTIREDGRPWGVQVPSVIAVAWVGSVSDLARSYQALSTAAGSQDGESSGWACARPAASLGGFRALIREDLIVLVAAWVVFVVAGAASVRAGPVFLFVLW